MSVSLYESIFHRVRQFLEKKIRDEHTLMMIISPRAVFREA